MRNSMRLAATTLAASTLAVGALTALSPPAEAKIDSGRYTYVTWNHFGEQTIRQEIKIIGNRIFVKRGISHVLHPTPRGAWYDNAGVRTTFWRSGDGYAGTQKPFWDRANRVRLLPGWGLDQAPPT
ncbi:MAG: hypothetical protein QM658_15785 [Gordonia sp. (in: high G+C Gram-positive bacteria)]